MRTSITEIIRAERFLAGELRAEDKLLYEARLVVDRDLRTNLFFHRMVHRLLRLYHRKKLRTEVEIVGQRLFRDPAKADFRQAVLKHFKS